MGMMRILDQLLQVQRGHLLAWGPVFLGLGIGVYFALPVEPGIAAYGGVAVLGGAAVLFAFLPHGLGLLARAILITCLGVLVAGLRSHAVEAPVLGFRYYGPVEGRLVEIDRSGRDLLRLTLADVRLKNVPIERTPVHVRISVLADSDLPEIGAQVATTAHLMPPQGPVEPGGFDFRRHAWFAQLGASGYSRVAVLTLAPAVAESGISHIRSKITSCLHHRLPGEVGAIVDAITTGDRSGVSQATLEDLRASNLAHLLAISGLHMGLVAGFVFGSLRFGLCLVPPLALRVNIKKVAAAVALVAAAGYLALSGGNVATERAFLMVAVMFVAVLMDRRAISLRAVAVAATLVLLRRPESLLSPGFQMSFAATAALVGVFAWISDRRLSLGPDWLRPVTALILSSLVAGLATAPFGAAHFNTLAHYGLPANLLSVPIMGAVVVPAAVMSLVLLPFGLEGLALAVLDSGLRWILAVAAVISDIPGAQGAIVQPSGVVLPLISLGGLFVLIWQGWFRFAGLLPITLALAVWSQSLRPLVLVAPDGGLVGVLGSEGRALSREKGQGFAARVWLENDGDRVSQKQAFGRWAGKASSETTHRKASMLPNAQLGGFRLVHAFGKRAADRLGHCDARDIVVTTVDIDLSGPCLVLGPGTLRSTGSLSIDAEGRITTARQVAGTRLWTLHSGSEYLPQTLILKGLP